MALDAPVQAAPALDTTARNLSAPLELVVCRDQLRGDIGPALLARSEQAGATITEVAPVVMDRLTDREEPQGLVATFPLLNTSLDRLPPPPSDAPSLVLVLDRLQDPGNCGTLIRTADAVGAHAVILIEPSVDPFDPKTVGASMGSLFNLPLLATDEPNKLGAALAPWTVVAAAAHQGDLAWESHSLQGHVALVLGNEARGLSDDLARLIQHTVRLPLPGKAESLNVAVAGGALAYEWLRRNNPKSETTAD